MDRILMPARSPGGPRLLCWLQRESCVRHCSASMNSDLEVFSYALLHRAALCRLLPKPPVHQ